MSVQYSNIIDPRLIDAIKLCADALCKISDAYDRRTMLMFPVVKNCGTCKFFDRKNLLDGICFVDGKENVKRRRVNETPCEKHEDFYESKVSE